MAGLGADSDRRGARRDARHARPPRRPPARGGCLAALLDERPRWRGSSGARRPRDRARRVGARPGDRPRPAGRSSVPGPTSTALPAAVRPRRERADALQAADAARRRARRPRVPPGTADRSQPAALPGVHRPGRVAAVGARMRARAPELVAAGIHLIVTQLPDGDLILGDTHEYGDTVAPFSDERLDELVLGRGAAPARAPTGSRCASAGTAYYSVRDPATRSSSPIRCPAALVVEVDVGRGDDDRAGPAPSAVIEGRAGAVTEPKPKNDQVAAAAQRDARARERVLVMDGDLERVAAVAVDRDHSSGDPVGSSARRRTSSSGARRGIPSRDASSPPGGDRRDRLVGLAELDARVRRAARRPSRRRDRSRAAAARRLDRTSSARPSPARRRAAAARVY